MKKILASTALFLLAGLAGIFAQTNKKADKYLLASFQENFSNASDVNWKQVKNYTEATFTMNKKQLSIFYNQDNSLFAVSRNISPEQLPLALFVDLKKNYNKYWVSDLLELTIEGHTRYYITLETADKKKIMKSDEYGQWNDYQVANMVSR